MTIPNNYKLDYIQCPICGIHCSMQDIGDVFYNRDLNMCILCQRYIELYKEVQILRERLNELKIL